MLKGLEDNLNRNKSKSKISHPVIIDNSINNKSTKI